MKPTDEIRRDNLKKILKVLGKQEKLAELLGVNVTRISQLNTSKAMGAPTARRIEKVVRPLMHTVTHAWMDQDHSDDEPKDDPERSVSVISWSAAGGTYKQMKAAIAGNLDEGIRTSRKVSVRAFALRVRDESMFDRTQPPGADNYPPGCVILVDPEFTAKDGHSVLVKLSAENDPIFRRLTMVGDRQYLRPLNPQWGKVVPMPFGAKIIGVVVQMQNHVDTA